MIDTGYKIKSGITRNKFLAFEDFKDTHIWPAFVYDGDRLQLDHAHEPSQDLQTLIDARAREIRETSDYVRLFFSGGSDSVTILESFYRQKLPIDEMVLCRHSPTDTFDDECNFELADEVVPFFKRMSKVFTHTKFTELNIGSHAFKKYFNSPDWIYERKIVAEPLLRTNYTQEIVQMHDPSFFDTYEKHDKVVELFGEQKPRLVDHRFELTDLDLLFLIGWVQGVGFYMTKSLQEKQINILKKTLAPDQCSDYEKNKALGRMKPISAINDVSKNFVAQQYGFFTDKQTISLLATDKKLVYNYWRGYMEWYMKQRDTLWTGDWTTFPSGVYGKYNEEHNR